LSCYGCLDIVLHCPNALFWIHPQASLFLAGTIWTIGEEAHKVGVCLSVQFFSNQWKTWVLFCCLFILWLLWDSLVGAINQETYWTDFVPRMRQGKMQLREQNKLNQAWDLTFPLFWSPCSIHMSPEDFGW
jgi:hypothetical protein